MRTPENVQIVKDFFAAIGSGDKQGLLALVAKDFDGSFRRDWLLAGAPTVGTRD